MNTVIESMLYNNIILLLQIKLGFVEPDQKNG